jgi:hypothetical protein
MTMTKSCSVRLYLALFLILLCWLSGTLQVHSQVMAQEGYPAPALTEPAVDGAYPPAAATGAANLEQASPIGSNQPPAGNTGSVPGNASPFTPEMNVQALNPQASLGRYYLWGGFTAALFILVTSVYGTITLFIRRKE